VARGVVSEGIVEAEVAMAILTGAWRGDESYGIFVFGQRVVSFRVVLGAKRLPIEATITLSSGPTMDAQTSCTAMTLEELKWTTLVWAVRMALIIESNKEVRNG
jgi:hypothetical protein